MNAKHLFVTACFAVFLGCAGDPEISVEIRNDLSFDRTAEVVSIPWGDIASRLPSATADRMEISAEGSRESLTYQLMHAEGDTTPVEVLFQASVPANGMSRYSIRSLDAPHKVFPPKTDARFVTPREDFAWENDRIAFRMYGPAMAKDVDNGIDVWTKRVRYVIVEKWYKANESSQPGHDSYHEDHGEGADFFSVGKTLGGGGSALFENNALVQPGVFSSYKLIVAGPLRCIFELTYAPVMHDGMSLRETKRIQLDAGENLNRIDVKYSGSDTGQELIVAAGIVKRKGVVSTSHRDAGWVSLYGMTTANAVDEHLGTGIVVPPESMVGLREDDQHLMILCSGKTGSPLTYYAGAGWTRSGDFSSKEDWENYLAHVSARLRSPLRVSVIP